MTTKHTPGPWKFGGINTGHVYRPDSRAVCTLSAFADKASVDFNQMRIDGALIAAAPEMLRLLKTLYAAADKSDCDSACFAAVRALLHELGGDT